MDAWNLEGVRNVVKLLRTQSTAYARVVGKALDGGLDYQT